MQSRGRKKKMRQSPRDPSCNREEWALDREMLNNQESNTQWASCLGRRHIDANRICSLTRCFEAMYIHVGPIIPRNAVQKGQAKHIGNLQQLYTLTS